MRVAYLVIIISLVSSYIANDHGHGEGARPKLSQGAGNDGDDEVVSFPALRWTGSEGKGPLVDQIPAEENKSL